MRPGAKIIVSVANGFLYADRENSVIPGLILPGTGFVDLYRGMETAKLVSTQLADAGFEDIQISPTNTEIHLTGTAA